MKNLVSILTVLLVCGVTAAVAVETPDRRSSGKTALEITQQPIRVDSFEVQAIEPFTRTLPGGEQVVYDRKLLIRGSGFYGTSVGPWVHFDEIKAWGVELVNDKLVTVYLQEGFRGFRAFKVTNPDKRSAKRVGRF